MLTIKIMLFSCLLLIIGWFMVDDGFSPGYIVLFIGFVGVVAAPLLALMMEEDM